MDWLSDIIKNLAISKTLVAAVFVTSVVMYVGPIVVPGGIPKIQPDFVPYLFVVMVLTGCLLLFWGIAAFLRLTKDSVRSATRVLADSTLSEPETALLFAMAIDPTQPINLNNIDYSRAHGTKLEFHHWTKKLEEKGLARINEWDDNLVSLTDKGREQALKIQKQSKRQSEA